MMPKLIALARRRISLGMPSTGTAEHLGCGHGVDIYPVGKGLAQLRNVGHMGEYAQFRSGCNPQTEACARRRNESGADLAPSVVLTEYSAVRFGR